MPDVVVIGAGRMGALHAQTVHACEESRLVGVVDTHPERAEALAHRFGCEVGLQQAALYIVATPASSHATVAAPLLDAGHVLVEKPLSPSWDPIWEHEHALAAWSERYHPDLLQCRVHREFSAVRERISRAPDVDLFGDLLVHDLDLLCWKTEHVELESVRPRIHLSFAGGTATLEVANREGTVEHRVDGRVLRRSVAAPDPLTRQLRTVLDHLRTGHPRLQARHSRRVFELLQEIRCASPS